MTIKTGRNELCPCGSAKKFKRCCIPRLTNTAPLPSGKDNPLLAYALAYKKWIGKLEKLDESCLQDALDRLGTSLNLLQYKTVLKEIEADGECFLLPTELPDLWMDVLASVNNTSRLLRCCKIVADHLGFDEYRFSSFDVHGSELGPSLSLSDLTFECPPSGRFPLLLHHFKGVSYAPQYVDDVTVFSGIFGENVKLPIIHYSRPLDQFAADFAFLHELIHVFQRVFRKSRLPYYPYTTKDGIRRVKNAAYCVQTGIEDEIEVQRLLVLMGCEFKLNPILYHFKSLINTFHDVSRQEMREAFVEGIDSIPFWKYANLHGGLLRETLLDHFCGVSVAVESGVLGGDS